MVENALRVGDRVRLIAETLAWRTEITLQCQIGEIIERREDGRITIRFDNGRLLMAREPESFEPPADDAQLLTSLDSKMDRALIAWNLKRTCLGDKQTKGHLE